MNSLFEIDKDVLIEACKNKIGRLQNGSINFTEGMYMYVRYDIESIYRAQTILDAAKDSVKCYLSIDDYTFISS